MKKFFKSRVFACVFMAFVLVASTAQITAAVVTKDVPSTEDVVNESVSSLKVQVKTLNGSYLKDAKVTVIETGKSYYTDKYGYTPVMQVPFNENALTNTFEGDFAFITIVVSKTGYIDYILFNCVVYRDRMRNGPVITMFSKQESGADFIGTVEIPPDDWTKEFLKSLK